LYARPFFPRCRVWGGDAQFGPAEAAPGNAQIVEEAMLLTQSFRRAAQVKPQAIAHIEGEGTLSWPQFVARVAALAGAAARPAGHDLPLAGGARLVLAPPIPGRHKAAFRSP